MSQDAGKLRHRVLIENRTVTDDPLGGQIITWMPISTPKGDGKVWARISYPSGTEKLSSNAIIATTKTLIRIRWRSDLQKTCRITHEGRVFNIAAIRPDGDSGREFLDIDCEDGANDG